MIASEAVIEDRTYIGVSANVVQRIRGGQGSRIGGNSLVTRALPDGSSVLGVRAKKVG